MFGRDWLDEDALWRGTDMGASAVLDFKLSAKPTGNNHLTFHREANGVYFRRLLHDTIVLLA